MFIEENYPVPTGGVPRRITESDLPNGKQWGTQQVPKKPPVPTEKKHTHYHKDVSNLDKIDVYRVLRLFNVTDPCLQHAIKKLLVAGGRGTKAASTDIQEAIDSCARYLAMELEDASEV